MKIAIKQSIVGNKLMNVKLPIRWYKTSEVYGFSMNKDGKGSYLGPNQNWGGPVSGDLVLFNTNKKPFVAIITYYTQDYVTRKCELEFLCWLSDFWKNVKSGLIQAGISNEIEDSKIFKYTSDTFSLDTAAEVSIEISKAKMKKYIQSL